MPLERRNEPQMLRQFHKMYPSYNINPLLRRRHQDLVEAQSFFLLCTRTAQVGRLATVGAGFSRPLSWWQCIA